MSTEFELDADVLGGQDAVVLLTDHDGIDYDLVSRTADYVPDTASPVPGASVAEVP